MTLDFSLGPEKKPLTRVSGPMETDSTPMTRTLGERIQFKKRLVRSYDPLTKQRVWRSYDFGNLPTREGIIVGWRNLANGEVTYGNGYDESTQFHPKSYVRAYLVVENMRQSPFYVLPSDILERPKPEWDYTTTTGPRKSWDDPEQPPEGEGWEIDRSQGRDGWERFDYHEESYWRRPYHFYEAEQAARAAEEEKDGWPGHTTTS